MPTIEALMAKELRCSPVYVAWLMRRENKHHRPAEWFRAMAGAILAQRRWMRRQA